MKLLFRTPALLTLIGVIFFLLIQWPYFSFIDQTLPEDPYTYWFSIWGILTLFLFLFATFVEHNDQ